MATCNLFRAACLASKAANWWSASRRCSRLTQMPPSQLAWLLNPLLEMSQITPNIPSHFTFVSELTLRPWTKLAVSSTFQHYETRDREEKNKNSALTLFCCPWFSYNIATAPGCRRLYWLSERHKIFPLVLPSLIRNLCYLYLIPVESCCDDMLGGWLVYRCMSSLCCMCAAEVA